MEGGSEGGQESGRRQTPSRPENSTNGGCSGNGGGGGSGSRTPSPKDRLLPGRLTPRHRSLYPTLPTMDEIRGALADSKSEEEEQEALAAAKEHIIVVPTWWKAPGKETLYLFWGVRGVGEPGKVFAYWGNGDVSQMSEDEYKEGKQEAMRAMIERTEFDGKAVKMRGVPRLIRRSCERYLREYYSTYQALPGPQTWSAALRGEKRIKGGKRVAWRLPAGYVAGNTGWTPLR